MSKAKFKIGERIKIIVPEFFVRCGYPMTMEMARQEVEDKWHGEIVGFLDKLGFGPVGVGYPGYAQAYEGVIRSLASGLLNKQRFGGPERKIHTRRIPELEGETCWVSGLKYVKTGYYTASSWSGPYSDEDYEPAYLADQKTHRIVMTSLVNYSLDSLWIEDCHVKKVDP